LDIIIEKVIFWIPSTFTTILTRAITALIKQFPVLKVSSLKLGKLIKTNETAFVILLYTK